MATAGIADGFGQENRMRYPAFDKLETLRLVEQSSHLPVNGRRVLNSSENSDQYFEPPNL
jgi:hypothetical protein